MAQMVIGIAVLDRVIGLPILVTRFMDTHYLQTVLMEALGDNSKPFASLAKWALALVQGCPSIAVGNSRPLLRRVHLVGIRLFTRSLSRHST